MAPRSLTPGKFNGLRRLADADGRFKMLAVDARAPIERFCAVAREEEVERAEDVRAVKRLILRALAPKASGVLADPAHGLMDALAILAPENGLIVALEEGVHAELNGSRMSKETRHWSVSKIRRLGGDAVKALVWHRPDQDAASLRNQKDFCKRVGEACDRYDIPFLLEALVYPLENDDKNTVIYAEQPAKRSEHVLKTVEEFAGPDYGVDLFRLESPMPAAEVPGYDDEAFDTCRALFRQMGRIAGRPWVMHSAGAGAAAFRGVLRHAYEAGASGYLAGRAIWWDSLLHFPDLDAVETSLRRRAATQMAELNALTDREAKPWTDWFDPALPVGYHEEDFPAAYVDCEGRI